MTYKHTYKYSYTYKEGGALSNTKTLYLSDEALNILETKENMSKYVSELIVKDSQQDTMSAVIRDIEDIKDIINRLLIENGYLRR